MGRRLEEERKQFKPLPEYVPPKIEKPLYEPPKIEMIPYKEISAYTPKTYLPLEYKLPKF
jgi:hypothetical protein